MSTTGNTSTARQLFAGAGVVAVLAGAAGLGLSAGTAQAQPGFVPEYHWCPGQ